MTVESVAEGVRHFLASEVESPTPFPELALFGVPDEALGKLLEAKGGEVRITVRAVPEALAADLAAPISTAQPVAEPDPSAMFWSPQP